MNEEELAQLSWLVKAAGLIRIFHEGQWIDLRPHIVEQITQHQVLLEELRDSQTQIEELKERLDKVANQRW
jgi:predicted nuclease with TOPRIM domain